MPFLYSSMNLYAILIAYSLGPTVFKYVGIFRLSLFVLEILLKQFLSFFYLFAVKKKKFENYKVFDI